jgi:DNA sulfur modification protein DndB
MATKKRKKYPAFKVSAGEREFYVTVMSGKKLFKMSEVSRADSDPQNGYQRLLSKKRAQDIANYIDQGNPIPGSVIVSAQPSASLQYDEKSGSIAFFEEPNAFLVIDGQHRLYGAEFSGNDTELVTTIFDDLDLKGEVQYFLDVNSNQRGVPKTLQLEILKFSEPEESQDQIRIKLFKELSENPQSPLCGKMSATKSAAGKITHVPFKQAIDPLFKIEAFADATTEQKAKLLINFLSAVEAILSGIEKVSMLTNSAFFRALFSSFRPALNMAMLKHGNCKEKSFKDVLAPLEHIDWDAHKGTNNAAIADFSAHIVSLIESTKISDVIL